MMPRLIDADKAKEVLTKLLYETAMNNSGGASLMCEDIAENRLETWFGLVPAVDAVIVRHGRWVNHISENGATDGRYCGICDYEVDRDARYNYCPNCGADMREVEE